MNKLRRLKILLLTPQLPYPPEQGTSLRNFNILRGLAQFHEIHLLSFAEGGQQVTDSWGPLQALCEQIVTVPAPHRTAGQRLWRLFRDRRPDMAHRLHSPQFEQRLRRLLEEQPFDIVQIEGIELAAHINLIRQSCPGCKIVFDNHNAEAELQRRMFVTDLSNVRRWPAAAYSFIQWRRLRTFERWACRAAHGVSVVSEADRDHLRGLAPEIAPVVIPNCIDIDRYAALPQPADATFERDLLFIGKMDYRPNVDAMLWFGKEIWPRIRQKRAHTTLAIVGKQPHPRLLPLADEPGIEITGAVPAVDPYLAAARVYVMPFRIGSGTRLKLIEALAAGVAMVSTRVGAEGYPVEDRRHLWLEDQPESFADAVVELLESEQERRALQEAGREFAARYDWRRVVPRFNTLYARLFAP